MTEIPSVPLLGYRFVTLPKEQLAEQLLCTDHPLRVYTPNPEMLFRASKDRQLKNILQNADLLLPDGVGITLTARLIGSPLPHRLPGIDVAECLLAQAARHGESVYLLGSAEHVAERAADRLQEAYRGLKIVGTHHGYFDRSEGSEENQALCQRLRDLSPTLLFVCLGCPAQEKWIEENLPHLPSVRIAMGLGGALDVWSGTLHRAPRLFRTIGLEWLWRCLLQPKRLLRLGSIPVFLLSALREKHS